MNDIVIFADQELNGQAVVYAFVGAIVLCVFFGALALVVIKIRNKPAKEEVEEAEKREWQNAINQGRNSLRRLYGFVQKNPRLFMLYDQAQLNLDMAQFRLNHGRIDDARFCCATANMYMRQLKNMLELSNAKLPSNS